jgi:hypothetical protein
MPALGRLRRYVEREFSTQGRPLRRPIPTYSTHSRKEHLGRAVTRPQRGLYDQQLGYTAELIKTMQPSVPLFLPTIVGVFAAMIFMSPFVHWLALVQTSLAMNQRRRSRQWIQKPFVQTPTHILE